MLLRAGRLSMTVTINFFFNHAKSENYEREINKTKNMQLECGYRGTVESAETVWCKSHYIWQVVRFCCLGRVVL